MAYPPAAGNLYLAYTQVGASSADLETRLASIGGGVFDPVNYGAVGNGVTDDTAAFQAAENARLLAYPLGGGTLRPAGGRTYAIAAATGAAAFKVKAPGLVDFSACTLKYTGAGNLTVGSDSGSIGIVNVLVSGVELRGTIDGNAKVRYPLGIASSVNGLKIDIEIKNTLTTPSGVWCGIHYACSVDVTGVAISGRAKNVAGWLRRPQCPLMDGLGALTGTFMDVTAIVLGSDRWNNNSTGFAFVLANNYNMTVMLMDPIGLPVYISQVLPNTNMGDLICHDLGTNAVECYGHPNSGGNYGQNGTRAIGMLIKNGATVAFYRDNYAPSSTDTEAPNVLVHAGTNAGEGLVSVKGRMIAGSVAPTYGVTVTVNALLGNLAIVTVTNGVAFTMAAPTNPPAASGETQRLSIIIRNSSGGTMGAITWNAAYKLGGTFVNPANGAERLITFDWNGTAWVELAPTAAASSAGAPVMTVTTTTTLVVGDWAGANTLTVLADMAGGTLNLPSVTALSVGQRLTVIKVNGGAGTITIDPAGAETIRGNATEGITGIWGTQTIVNNGVRWENVGSSA